MAGFFSKLFGSEEQRAIGIDIGKSAIKVVQIKTGDSQPVLETYGALAVGPYVNKAVGETADLSVDQTVNALTDLMREAKTSTNQGGIAIPFHSTLMNLMELPQVEEEELQKMVPIEARKYIPVSMSEVQLDWSRIDEDVEEEGDSIKILTVAIHNDVINRYQKIVTKADLNALFFEVEIFSTMRSVMPEETEPVMIFDMGSANTKLYMIENRAVHSTHTINQGSQSLTYAIADALDVDKESAEMLKRGMQPQGQTQDRSREVRTAIAPIFDQIFSEAVHFLKNHESENGKEIQRVMLVGGGVKYQHFAELAEKQFEAPVEYGNPFDRLQAPSFLGDTLRETGPEFAVATGIALRQLQNGG